MKSRMIAALVAVNAVLLGGLVWRTAVESPATAQQNQQLRRPGEYVMIPGEATGAAVGIVYVLDVANGELGAIAPNNQDKLEAMRPLNLIEIFDRAAASAGPAAGNPARRR